MRPVAVFDTNVLFSALGWRGKPYQCLELARMNAIEGITCDAILDELVDKLGSKLQLPGSVINDSILDLLSFLRLVELPPEIESVSADRDDDKVLAAGLVVNATHMITGDKRHLLGLGAYRGIFVVSPSDFLNWYLEVGVDSNR